MGKLEDPNARVRQIWRRVGLGVGIEESLTLLDQVIASRAVKTEEVVEEKDVRAVRKKLDALAGKMLVLCIKTSGRREHVLRLRILVEGGRVTLRELRITKEWYDELEGMIRKYETYKFWIDALAGIEVRENLRRVRNAIENGYVTADDLEGYSEERLRELEL